MVTRLDRRITAADLDDLPHEWDTLYELIGGILFVSRKPSLHHQRIVTRMVIALAPPVKKRGGEVFAEPGVVWEDRGLDNVAPDVAIVLGPRPRVGKLRTCPEICIEVLSPGRENRDRDLIAKRDLYWRRGAKESWIVDPESKTLLRLTRDKTDWREEGFSGATRVKTPVLKGWRGLSLGDLFE